MDNILPNTDFTEFENRVYLNPQVGLDESNTFIDNLRSTQGQQNQEIFTDTQRLGANVPSDIGGLTGANSYFTSRYQTPQTNANVANLRATAQAAALNQVLANEQEVWKKRYQDAYKAYQKRNWDKANQSLGTSSGESISLEVDTNENNNNSTDISQYTGGEYQKETLYPATDYMYDWQDANGQWWQISSPTFQDVNFGPTVASPLAKKVNGNITTVNGKDYIYLDSIPNQPAQWFPITRSAGPGTYSPYAGS